MANNLTYTDRLSYAFRQLKTYNKVILYGIPEETFSIPEIEAGFNSPLDSDAEKHAKKMLVAASTETILRNPAIPNSRKEKVARKNAEEIQSAFDLAKLDFAEISVPEREKRIRNNVIAKRMTKLESGIQAVKRTGTRLCIDQLLHIIESASDITIGIPSWVFQGLLTLIPENIKKAIKEKAAEMIDRAATKIESLSEKLKETSVGKKIMGFAKSINESKIVKTIRKTTAAIGEKFDTIRNKVNNGLRKTFDFAKSFF